MTYGARSVIIKNDLWATYEGGGEDMLVRDG
nr:MAG TPA: hypothetical protein [Caudoviricetes sp.]